MRYLLLIISFIFLTSCANTVESSKIKFLEGDYLVTGSVELMLFQKK